MNAEQLRALNLLKKIIEPQSCRQWHAGCHSTQ